MRYRAELYEEESMIAYANVKHASHPNQAIRVILSQSSGVEYAMIYVMNERGERWRYTMNYNGTNYNLRLVGRSQSYISKDRIDMVFAGELRIKEAAS
ncbi:MAG: hypothetical protein U9R08_03705 [Nanoarchaeota archaeon]|nr:hypothetical protein [Nanoarchaeota archaeon]